MKRCGSFAQNGAVHPHKGPRIALPGCDKEKKPTGKASGKNFADAHIYFAGPQCSSGNLSLVDKRGGRGATTFRRRYLDREYEYITACVARACQPTSWDMRATSPIRPCVATSLDLAQLSYDHHEDLGYILSNKAGTAQNPGLSPGATSPSSHIFSPRSYCWPPFLPGHQRRRCDLRALVALCCQRQSHTRPVSQPFRPSDSASRRRPSFRGRRSNYVSIWDKAEADNDDAAKREQWPSAIGDFKRHIQCQVAIYEQPS